VVLAFESVPVERYEPSCHGKSNPLWRQRLLPTALKLWKRT
jgi:hypothetical protein